MREESHNIVTADKAEEAVTASVVDEDAIAVAADDASDQVKQDGNINQAVVEEDNKTQDSTVSNATSQISNVTSTDIGVISEDALSCSPFKRLSQSRLVFTNNVLLRE